MSMSAQQDVRVVEFSAPTGLNVPVIGKDPESDLTFFNPLSDNLIIRVIFDAPTGTKFEFDFLRDRKPTRTIYSSLLQSSLQGPVWAGFPLTVARGNFQIQMRQTAGTVTTDTQQIEIVYDHPLGQ